MNDDGASSTIAFLLAATLFTAMVGGILLNTERVADAGKVEQLDATLLSQQALHLRDLVLGSPGFGLDAQDDPVDWLQGGATDKLQRLGIRNATDGDISFSKLENLRRAERVAADDGFLNYEEARAALGLTAEGLDFHIRAYPSLKSVEELLASGVKDSNLRVTYVGDATSGSQEQAASSGPTIGSVTCAISPLNNQAIRLTAPVTNTGTVSTHLHSVWTVEFGNKDVDDTQGAPVVDAGNVVDMVLDVPAEHGDCDDITEISIDVFDPTASLTLETLTPSFTSASATHTGDVFRVDPDQVYHTTSDTVVIVYDGDLQAKQGNTVGETITLSIIDNDGDNVLPGSVTNPITVPKTNEDWEFDGFAASALGVGSYEIRLTRANGQVATDTLTITSGTVNNFQAGASPPPTGHTYSAAAQGEVDFLDQLVYRFCPFEWDSQSAAIITTGSWTERCETPSHGYPAYDAAYPVGQYSDVFPDDKQLLGNELHRRLVDGAGLPRYDLVNTLVVGSGVDHNTMTSQVVKGTIKDWVLGGGNLIVFGSEKQVVQWLQPIFKASLDSSSTGLTAPDDQHSLLQVADTLSWDAYNTAGRAWNLKQGSGNQAQFTRVVEDGEDNSVLAISDPGAYGDGTVVLTSWQPYDLFGTGSVEKEGLKLVNNLLMQGYRDLFLDYGPEIPEGTAVTAALGRGQVWHPELERHVTLDLHFYVF